MEEVELLQNGMLATVVEGINGGELPDGTFWILRIARFW